jgi:predicted MFS family arabinose efflux permease
MTTEPIPHLKNSTLAVMTVATGLVIANIYYNQPLLVDVANTYHISSAKAGQVSTITQIGYATGMLLFAPLADMFKRKRLMLIDLSIAIIALLVAASASSIYILLISCFFVGVFSHIPQLLMPMAAHLANPNERGKKIGVVMSGLLIGILLSRTLSGFICANFGWRTVFYMAAGLMVIVWGLIFFLLPEINSSYKGTYKNLLISMLHLVKKEPTLRIAAVRGALCFACFSAFWTTLAFLLKQNFNQGSDVAGLFGLVGAFGAVAAGFMGRLSDKMDAFRLTTVTIILLLLSFVVFIFSAYSMIGLVIGVIAMDMGMQATHLSNQTLIFALDPNARNRINTIYMVTYFLGGATGSYLASHMWDTYQWNGVCIMSIVVSAIVLIIHLVNRKKLQRKPITVQS